MRALARKLGRGLLALLSVILAFEAVMNVLLNLALPALINQRPERVRVVFDSAWMFVPGQVQVRGLQVRGQGLTDQWRITAEEVSARVSLPEIYERRFRAGDVRARGVSVRYRRRLEPPPAPTPLDAPPERVEASNDPPIQGFTNPPELNPDVLYPAPKRRWLIRLDDIRAYDVREIWIGDYRLTGSATLAANLAIADPYIDIDGDLLLDGLRADIGDTPVAVGIWGTASILVDSMDRLDPGPDRLAAVSGKVRVGLDVEELRFLDFYLAGVPWLSLGGVGHVEVDARFQDGQFRVGSALVADFPELLVRFVTDDVTGAGRVRAEVGEDVDGQPESRLSVDFDDFAVTPDGGTAALAEGTGFHVGLVSPDVALNQPFTEASLVVDLPRSRIPDLSMYNLFLPADTGLTLVGGTGDIAGHLEASTAGSTATGELTLNGDEVQVRFDSFVYTADLALRAVVTEARLDLGRYTLGRTTLDLTQGGLVNRARRDATDGARRWRASVVVTEGVIQVQAPIYLDARLTMRCTDSVPFVRVFTDGRKLPAWARGAMSVSNVSGEARLRLGQRRLEVSSCRIRSGKFKVDLRFLRRDGLASQGDLLLSLGPLAVGVGLRGSERELHVFRARKWYSTPYN